MRLPHSAAHWALLFGQHIDRKNYVPKPKMTWFKYAMIVPPFRAHKLSNWRSASPYNRVQRYCRFAFSESITKDSSIILKFHTNKKNSYDSPLSNKSIFNLYKSDFSDIGYLRNLIFTKSISDFVSFLFLIQGVGGGSTWFCAAPVHQIFLCKHFLIVECFILIQISVLLLCKVSYTLSNY